MCDLKTAIDKCKINFDKRILITDLIDEYDITIAEVQKTLQEYLSEEEKGGTKFEKQYLVYGEDKTKNNEIYTIVNSEKKLKEWLQKLSNAESALYSVQIAGGAKAPAQDLKPVRHCGIKLKNLELRNTGINGSVNAVKSEVKNETKTAEKTEVKKTGIATAFASKPVDAKPKPELKDKKSTPDSKPTTSTTPENKQTSKATTATGKKTGINNFFAPASKASSKTDSKPGNAAAKPPTPKKMEDFFHKKSEKTTPKKEIKNEPANTSVQLFDADDEQEKVESESSDEEENIEALKRNIISSDNEQDEAASSSTAKRRRILDSDDEETSEQPQNKIEKIDDANEVKKMDDDVEEQPKSETYLDDEGFVITIKSKHSNTINKKQIQKSPPAAASKSKKSPMKSVSKTPQPPAKTKQGNIMSFFTKK